MKKRNGFTLLEGMMTMVLLIGGIAVIFRIFSISFIADSYIDQATIAVNLCQEEMESIKDAGSYAAIDTFASARTSLTGDFSAFEKEVIVAG